MPIAALGVAVFVFHAGYDMGRRTIDVLMDTAPEGVADDVRRVARTVCPGWGGASGGGRAPPAT